jgi:hypothetical protein
VSALTRRTDTEQICQHLKLLRPTQLVISMTDQTHRLGGAVAAALDLQIPILSVSDSPSGVGRLKSASPNWLAERILSSIAADSTPAKKKVRIKPAKADK